MDKGTIKKRLRFSVYVILFGTAIFFILIGNDGDSYLDKIKNTLSGLSVELIGAIILFLIADYYFLWEKDDDVRNDRLDAFLDDQENNANKRNILLDNYLSSRKNEKFSTVFKTNSESKYSLEFYEYFDRVIRNAKRDIYITGEGFGGVTSENKVICDNFIEAQKVALEKGVNIVRLQTKSFVSEYWNDKLLQLLKKYPNFNLYLSNSPIDHGAICSVDYSDNNNCVAEFMLSIPRMSGIVKSNLAGLAVFIEKDYQLAIDMKDMILSETINSDSSIRITKENFELHMNNSELYFTFGSNMLESRIKSRCPSARRVDTVATISDYRLVFDRQGDYEKGGVASIVPSLGDVVYGALYLISSEDLLELDRIESPNGNSYYRKTVVIETQEKDLLQANTYISYPQGKFDPTKNYLSIIIKGAIESKLPKDYVNELKKLDAI